MSMPTSLAEWRSLLKTLGPAKGDANLREWCFWEMLRIHRQAVGYSRGCNRGWSRYNHPSYVRISTAIPWPPEPVENPHFKWQQPVNIYAKLSKHTGLLNVVIEVWELKPQTAVRIGWDTHYVDNSRVVAYLRLRVEPNLFIQPIRILSEVRWALEDAGLLCHVAGTQWCPVSGLGCSRG